MSDKYSVLLFIKLAAYCVCFAVVFSVVLLICSSPVFDEEAEQTASLAERIAGEVPELPVVIIDAGHGGMDGGASTSDGICEKDINLAVAKRLEAVLVSAGIKCRLTRSEDIMLCDADSPRKKMQDLKNRLEMTVKYKPCIFISIHQNKFPQTSCRGLQVYYSKNDSGSQILAQSIQSTVADYIQPDNKREIKRADSAIYLLDNAKVPAVMAECGFLSNPDEASLLVTEDYQNRLCAAIFAAVIAYLDTLPQDITVGN